MNFSARHQLKYSHNKHFTTPHINVMRLLFYGAARLRGAPAENAFQLEKKSHATLRENQVRRCEFGWPSSCTRSVTWTCGAGGSSEYPVHALCV
jgi:hypothetical protein